MPTEHYGYDARTITGDPIETNAWYTVNPNDYFITKKDLEEELDKFWRKMLHILNQMKYLSFEIDEDEFMKLLLEEEHN